jgi:hypothetical protein
MREFEKLHGQVEFAHVLSDVNPKSNWNGALSVTPAQQNNVQAEQITVRFVSLSLNTQPNLAVNFSKMVSCGPSP